MKKLPKIELHCHLDGSVRPGTIMDIAAKENIHLPGSTIEEIEKLMTVSEDCQSLEEYLEKFHLPNTLMQTKESLERITYELFEDAANENVKYLEVRFGPHLHTVKGMTLREVIASVVSGMDRAKEVFDIEGNIILSSLRNHSMESLDELIIAGKEFLGKGVVGLDLCSVENEGFVKPYIEAFKTARELGYRITIHAGEAASGTNVLESVEMLGAERIGHGVQLITNKEAVRVVKEKGVHLEMCPTSNVQTTAVDSLSAHPIMDYMNDGIKVSVATDNRTVSGTTMTKELMLVSNHHGMSLDDYRKMYEQTIEACFADEKVKEYLRGFTSTIA